MPQGEGVALADTTVACSPAPRIPENIPERAAYDSMPRVGPRPVW